MKKIIALAAVAAMAAFAAPAFAATSGSVGYSNFNVDSFNVGAVNGRFSWNQGMFGAEVEGAFGLQSSSNGTGASRDSAKLSSEVGAFVTANAPLSDEFQVFGRVGYANLDFKTTHGVKPTMTHDSASDSGFAYGAGAVWMFDGMDGIRGDYTHYDVSLGAQKAVVGPPAVPAVKGQSADAWSIGYVRKFN